MKEKINIEINKFVKKHDNLFINKTYDIIKDYVNNGGKRIRPIVCIMAYNSLKGGDEKIFLPAIGIEFFHNSTLCHDDIMDEDAKRRNKDSCHKSFQKLFIKGYKEKEYSGDIFSKESVRFGVSQAIIAGNIFNFLGYKCFLNSKFDEKIKNAAIKRITETMKEVNHGQILDIVYENEATGEKEYLDMIKRKTAMLLGSAFEIGAIFAGADLQIRKAFFEFGFNIGVAFQITDDLMDVDEESKKGNSFGSDIKKGKRTILMIKALDKAKKIDVSDIKKTVEIFRKTGAIDYARNLAETGVKAAKENLAKIKMSEEYMQYFIELADFIVKRKD